MVLLGWMVYIRTDEPHPEQPHRQPDRRNRLVTELDRMSVYWLVVLERALDRMSERLLDRMSGVLVG